MLARRTAEQLIESFGDASGDLPSRSTWAPAVTPYRARRVLDVPATAGAAEIRQAYMDLVRVWHPDRFDGDGRLRAKAGLRLAEINVAYRLLATEPANARAAGAAACRGSAVPRSGHVAFHPQRVRRASGWSGRAATAALVFGAACVVLALVLTSTPVV